MHEARPLYALHHLLARHLGQDRLRDNKRSRSGRIHHVSTHLRPILGFPAGLRKLSALPVFLSTVLEYHPTFLMRPYH